MRVEGRGECENVKTQGSVFCWVFGQGGGGGFELVGEEF